MAFGAELRQLRLERGYSLTELARLTYYSKGHLSKIENGRYLPQPEHAWQLDAVLQAGGALAGALPLVTAEPRPARPPSGLMSPDPCFVGRAAEAAILTRALCAPAAPDAAVVCAVDGMPGVGKTALACRVARALAPRFADGVLFLDLHGYSESSAPLSPADSLDRLLRRLGLPVPAEPDERASRFRAYLAEREMLIVLDNARTAAQVRPLIPATSASRLLITSRGRLAALDVTCRLPLGPLAPADGEELLRAAAGAAEPGKLAAVARACGGLPLALTILAARLRAGTTLADLHDSLITGHLESAGRLADLGDGERSVVSAFELSYQALPEDARRAFALLGLLPGDGWTIPYLMAAGQSTLPPAVRRAERLLGARLIERGEDGRLRFHDLVAAYARHAAAALPPQTARAAREHVLAWAVDLTFRADALIEPHRFRPPFRDAGYPAPFRDEASAARWLREECRSLVALCLAAHSWGADTACWQLAYALRGYFFLTKQWDDWTATHTAALGSARRAGDARAEAMTRNNLGLALLETGRAAAADEHFQAVLALEPGPGLEYGRANALANHGAVLYSRGSWAQSLGRNQEAYRFYIDRGMRRNAAITLRSIALNEIELGLFREAVAHLLEALATFTELGLTLNAVMARNCLGEACLRTGDLDGAQEWLLSAADGAEQPSSRYERARAMRSLGEIALARGDRDAAIARWQEALDIYEAVGAPEAAEVSGRMALAS